jgi:exopolyphosphatase / guanosine-5'-triphosphate,3'-diphosphate pyrophosphatase
MAIRSRATTPTSSPTVPEPIELLPRAGGGNGGAPANGGTERLAAIDVGSNSIHMIVVAPEPGGGYRVLDREREMVRLGRSALGRGTLSEGAMSAGVEALKKMTTLARLKGATRTVAVATSAVREAANGEEFLTRVKAQTGIDVRPLDGEEEARLIFRAVREVVDLGPKSAIIADVGGGSTEWIVTRAGHLQRVASAPVGSLRSAASLTGDPPSAASITTLRARLRVAIDRLPVPRRTERMVATSGTAVCAADLADLLGGRDWKAGAGVLREVRVKELRQVIDHLRRLKRRQIAALPPVGGPRAESILPGTVLLDELARRAGVDRFLVSDRALREGLVLETLGEPAPPAATAPEELRRRQVLQLAQRAETVFRHSVQAAELAVRFFDLTVSVHGMGAREREWLEYAALLHDIGYTIDYRKHHKHTYYLITNATLDTFDPREIEIIAHVARFHRGSRPKPKHPTLAALRPWQQRTIEKLTALLRISDSLDRTHASRVEEIYASIRRREVQIEVLSPYDVGLELEAAKRQGRLFERVFGRRLALRQGLEPPGLA